MKFRLNRSGSVAVIALRGLNVVLLCAACALAVYAFYHGKQMKVSRVHGGGIDVSIPVRSANRIKPTLPDVLPLGSYLTDLQKRDLFEAPWEKVKEPVVETIPQPIPETKTIMEFTQTVRLVGIISDNNPRAVVEDLVTRETLFITVGDQIKGATLDQIFGDKVIFKVGNEQVELYP